MKKTLAFLLALAMLLALAACGGGGGSVPTPKIEASAAPSAPAAPDAFVPVEADLGDGVVHISIIGAEYFEDSDGGDAIRIYYDFTNNDESYESAYMQLNVSATQSGFELVTAYSDWDDDVPEDDNAYVYVCPGVTIRCTAQFNYQPDMDAPVIFTVEESWSDDFMTAEFDPANLPGAPAEPLEIVPITDPDLTAGLSDSGSCEEYALSILDAEIVPGDDVDEVIRIYFEFTNNGEEAASCWYATYFYTFQDGIECEQEYAENSTESDDNYYVDIQPGETITCSCCFELRSYDPVEILCSEYYYDLYLGARYDIS